MQFSSDTALAAAIAAHDRSFSKQLLVDWGGTGLYDHAYSDLSTVVEDASTDRDLTGDVPDEINLVEGHQAAKLTARLAGTRPGDSLTIGEILSEFRTDSPMYGLLHLGPRIKYSIIVGTSEGPKTIRQFTGRVRGIDVDETGKVTMLGADHSELLRKAISLRPWAMDSVGRSEDYPDHVQQIYPQWPIDNVLRQCDIYQSPPLVDKIGGGFSVAMFSATLHGSWIAEVGDTLEFERAIDVAHNSMWTQGQFGMAANGVPSDFSMYSYYTPFATPWPEGWSVATGAWIYGPRATVNGTTDILFAWMNNDDSELYFRITDAGVLSANLQGPGYNVTFTGPTVAGAAAWHYVGVSLRRNGASGMVATFTIDGANTVVNHATAYPQFGSTLIQQNLVQIQSGMPLQCVQLWVITDSGTLVWPKDVITSANDLTPGSVLDWGTNGMTRIPDLYRVDGWETLRDIVAAEYGLLWLDEVGTVRFADRVTVRTPAPADDRTITLDHLTKFMQHNIADGVRNRYVYDVVQGVTYRDVSVFRASRDLEFDAPPGTTVFKAAVSNAQYTGRKSMLVVSPWPDADDWIQAGWHAVERGTATTAPGVEVAAAPIDQRTISITVTNPNPYWLRFISGANNRPAMRVDGRQITEELPRSGSVQHDGSIAAYAERVFEIPQSPWRSYLSSVENLARSLLRDTHTSIPTIDRVPCVGDPRTQLRDSSTVNTVRFGRMLGVIQGIHRTLSASGGLVDELTIRVIHPGGAWVLGDPVMSELGTTTVLN